MLDEGGVGVSRELRLYFCSAGADFGGLAPDEIAAQLANLLQMRVFALTVPIVFRPHLQLSPLDEIRGRVSLSDTGPLFLDVHRLDDDMVGFP